MPRHPMLRLGTVIYGLGQTRSSWLDPRLSLSSPMDINYNVGIAREAEAAGLDFIFLPDNPVCDPEATGGRLSRLEPVTLLSALAMVTSRIGLIPSISTSFTEPFNVARQLASLDNLSGGRAGWNVVTTGDALASLNFNRQSQMPHDERYARAAEHLAVVRGLWDSWEDDAFLFDRETRVCYDKSKLHILNHVGPHFSVKGPLNLRRSPQGQPVIAQAGSSTAGVALAAATAEIVFTGARSLEVSQNKYARMKSEVVKAGRSADDIILMAGVAPIIGSTEEEAERRYQEILAYTDIDDAIGNLKHSFGAHDFRQYPLDEPFPDLGSFGADGFQSQTEEIKANAKARGLTLREVALYQAVPRNTFIGTPEQIADEFERWFRVGATDGFILNVGPIDSLTDFIEHVLPILRRRGLYREDYPATTLRGNLGLPIPANAFAK